MKTNVKCEAEGGNNKIRITRVGIEEVTDKKEERNNKEEKSFIDEIKLPEVQVARKGSNQPEDTEPENLQVINQKGKIV